MFLLKREKKKIGKTMRNDPINMKQYHVKAKTNSRSMVKIDSLTPKCIIPNHGILKITLISMSIKINNYITPFFIFKVDATFINQILL